MQRESLFFVTHLIRIEPISHCVALLYRENENVQRNFHAMTSNVLRPNKYLVHVTYIMQYNA